MDVGQWLEAHARLRPQHPAVIDRIDGETVTYSDLRDRARSQAGRLRALGVRRGDRVAVFSGNRVEPIELLFACAHLGAVLVPLNTRLSTVELQGIVDDCRPAVLAVEPGLAAPSASAPVIPLRAGSPGEAGEPARVEPDDPILILYTGGTTGTPKGAVLSHRSLQANAISTVTGWGLRPDDRAPIFTPLFHTGGWNVLATPLFWLGGTVVLAPPFKAEAALRIIREERCTIVFMVPTMFAMLREVPVREAMASVRMLISGGAPCPQPLLEAYWNDGLTLRQGYGLTEAGPNNFGIDEAAVRQRPGTVGLPLPGVRVRLLKADGTPTADGEAGELWVSGDHLMAGYWRQPEATAAVLQDGWLRTGDLALVDADGYYYICGRSKEMYISGGENVFPAEVESVLLAHPAVWEAAVVGVPHELWGEVGAAWLVVREAVAADDIVAWCQARLARYKAPRHVHFVDALPRSAAGKILKRLLAEPAVA